MNFRNSLIEHAFLNSRNTAIKSFDFKVSQRYMTYFVNEIVTFQIIQEKAKILPENEDKYKISSSFAEYLGYFLNDATNPYSGSIVIKWYSFGDLSEYTRHISNPKWFIDTNKYSLADTDKEYILDDQKRASMPNEIIQLIDLVRQIAEGSFIF